MPRQSKIRKHDRKRRAEAVKAYKRQQSRLRRLKNKEEREGGSI